MVSNGLQQAAQGKVISVQQDAVSKTPEEDLTVEREKAVAYNERLRNGRAIVTDPFDPDAQRPSDEEYKQVLNIEGDGVMGTLAIPAIHVNLPIYHGTSDEVLQKGVGHLEGSSVPIGGDSTHAVLSGHTGLPSMKVFDSIDQLVEGDYFIIQVLGEDHAYRVTSIETVFPDETDSLVIQEGRDLCTLVTCTPYGLNTHRLLVHAERCAVPDEWTTKGDAEFPAGYSDPPDKALLSSVLLGLLLAALIIGGYVAWSKWHRTHGGVSLRRAEGSSATAAPAVPRSRSEGVQGVSPIVPVSRRATSSNRPSRSVGGQQVKKLQQRQGYPQRLQPRSQQSQPRPGRTHSMFRVVDGGMPAPSRHAKREGAPKDGTRTRGLHFRDRDR